MADACYIPNYRPFSFKGVPAICVDASYDGGRRGAEAEFPFGERSAYADLGKKIRRFHVKAVFRENSHLADSRRFFNACESPGPGTLIHPSYGSVRAAVKSIKVQDSPENSQGETSADIEFVEANLRMAGASLGALIAGVAMTPIVTALRVAFMAAYNPLQAAYYVAPMLTSVVTGMASLIRDQLVAVGGIRDDDTAYWRTVQEIGHLAAEPVRMLDQENAWLALSGGMAAISQYGASPAQKTQAFRAIANWAATLPEAPADAAVAQEAVAATSRVLAAAYMFQAALEDIPTNMQQSFAQYDRIMTLLEGESEIAYVACDNGLHLALREFITAAQSALLDRTYNLPAIVSYAATRSMLSIVAAHEIYGDARRFPDIESHNGGLGEFSFFVGPDILAPRAPIGVFR